MQEIKNYYFKLLEDQVEYSLQASDLLNEILCGYYASGISAQTEKMQTINNSADKHYHDALTRLSLEFITPIDQEDIIRFLHIIDTVTEELNQVVMAFYMFNINETPADSSVLSEFVNCCVKTLHKALKELEHKRTGVLRKLLAEINTVTREANNAYAQSIHNLFKHETDFKRLMADRAVYQGLENCCKNCKQAADVIEQIAVKSI